MYDPFQECDFAWGRSEAEKKLECKEGYTKRFDESKFGIVHRLVVCVHHQHLWECIDTHTDQGDEHHGHRHQRHDLGRQARLRFLHKANIVKELLICLCCLQEVPEGPLVRYEGSHAKVLRQLLLLLLVLFGDLAQYRLSPRYQLGPDSQNVETKKALGQVMLVTGRFHFNSFDIHLVAPLVLAAKL